MGDIITLENVLVKNSSAHASKPRGKQFVVGSSLNVVLPASEEEKINDIKKKVIEIIAKTFEYPIKSIKDGTEFSFDKETKLNHVYLNFTRAKKDRETGEYLMNDNGYYQEEITNQIYDEETGDLKKGMPIIKMGGAEISSIPYAGSLCDIKVLVRNAFDNDDMTVRFYFDMQEINITKAVENQGVGSKKKDVFSVDTKLGKVVGHDDEKTPDKKATEKTSAKKTKEDKSAPTDADVADLF